MIDVSISFRLWVFAFSVVSAGGWLASVFSFFHSLCQAFWEKDRSVAFLFFLIHSTLFVFIDRSLKGNWVNTSGRRDMIVCD